MCCAEHAALRDDARRYRLLRLLCNLIEEDVLRVATGARDGAGSKGVRQVCIVQRFEIAAAAANFAETQIILPCGCLVLGVLLF